MGSQWVVAEARDVESRTDRLSRAYRINMNVLALVALFTGAFLVFSTQALSVVRRRAQFAMLRVLGLTTAWQYAVYGAAIAAGMVISGKRIVSLFGGLMQRERVRAWLGPSELELADVEREQRQALAEGAK